MSDRARQVLEWIDTLERNAPLFGIEWEDIIAEPRLAPGVILLVGRPPNLPSFADLMTAEVTAVAYDAPADIARADELRFKLGLSLRT